MGKKKTSATTPADASFDSLFDTATAPEKKKAEDVPELKLSQENIDHLIQFLKHKKTMKSAETDMRIEEEPIIVEALDKLETDALAGKYNSSYVINFKDGDEKHSVKFITSDKFSFPTDAALIAQIKTTLGAEKFEEVTEEVKGLEIKPEVFTDKKLQADLMAALGVNLVKFFTPTKKRVLKKGFAETMYKIAGTKEKLAEIKELIPQSKPFLK